MKAGFNADLGPLFEALARARAKFPVVRLNRTANIPTKAGKPIKFQYADLASVVSAVAPILSEHGLTVTHTFDGATMITTLSHQSGGYIYGEAPMPEWGPDPKKWGAAATYVRRYSLLGIIGLVADEDHDATVLEQEPAPKPAPKPAPPAEPNKGDPSPGVKASIDKAFATLKLGEAEEERLCMKHDGDALALLTELRNIYVQREDAKKAADEGKVL